MMFRLFRLFAVWDPRHRGGARYAPAISAAVLSLAVGCAGTRWAPETTPEADPDPSEPATAASADHEPDSPRGLFHVVEPGQTLWRIARAYGVSMEQIAAANGVSDPSRLESGMTLWIPGASRPLDIAPYPAPPPRPGGTPATPSEWETEVSDFLWPVGGGALLSRFGDPRRTHRHAGIDIRGAQGQEILAANDGRVVRAGDSGSGYGKMVVLDHGDGLRTLYAHARQILVRVGEDVLRGQPIARVGRTGNATAEHCHFEIRLNDVQVDPLPFLSGLVEARR